MRHIFTIEEREFRLWAARDRHGHRVHVEDREYQVSCDTPQSGGVLIDGERYEVLTAVDGDIVHIWMDGETQTLRYRDPVEYHAGHGDASAEDIIAAPMPGVVIALQVADGQQVARGDTLMVIESMKLETAIKAPRDGIVGAVHLAVGQSFDRSVALVTLKAAG